MPKDVHARCSPAALKLVADYWVLRIVEELNDAADGLRFSALERRLDGVSPATLSNRLRRLEGEKLVDRAEAEASKVSVTYYLSARGRQVLPVIRAINTFAESAG